jgi:hypothetical protein
MSVLVADQLTRREYVGSTGCLRDDRRDDVHDTFLRRRYPFDPSRVYCLDRDPIDDPDGLSDLVDPGYLASARYGDDITIGAVDRKLVRGQVYKFGFHLFSMKSPAAVCRRA